MKIIATLTPDDVKPPQYRVRCLEGCECGLGSSNDFAYVQGYAEHHVRHMRHAVVIEAREDVVIHEFHGRTSP